MSQYDYTFDQYDFVRGDTVTVRLKVPPFEGLVVSFGENVEILTEDAPSGEGMRFSYQIERIPASMDGKLIGSQDFIDLVGNILFGLVERNFEENGDDNGTVEIHAPVDPEEDEEDALEPTAVEYNAVTGQTTIHYDK